MKRFCVFILLFVLVSSFTQKAHSQTKDVEVKATVGGKFSLRVAGFVSPRASVVLSTPEGEFLASAVADSHGDFSFKTLPINAGFSQFCLKSVDFKRVGESESCVSFSPARGDIEHKDLFLPPTMGLSKNKIDEGQDALIFGYSMPGAVVKLSVSNRLLEATAGSDGYYEVELKSLSAGKYVLVATARFENKDSLRPTKELTLESVSVWDKIAAFIKRLVGTLGAFWLIPLIILVVILIWKLRPRIFGKVIKPKKKQHHSWFIGF